MTRANICWSFAERSAGGSSVDMQHSPPSLSQLQVLPPDLAVPFLGGVTEVQWGCSVVCNRERRHTYLVAVARGWQVLYVLMWHNNIIDNMLITHIKNNIAELKSKMKTVQRAVAICVKNRIYVHYCLFVTNISLGGCAAISLQWCLQGGELGTGVGGRFFFF